MQESPRLRIREIWSNSLPPPVNPFLWVEPNTTSKVSEDAISAVTEANMAVTIWTCTDWHGDICPGTTGNSQAVSSETLTFEGCWDWDSSRLKSLEDVGTKTNRDSSRVSLLTAPLMRIFVVRSSTKMWLCFVHNMYVSFFSRRPQAQHLTLCVCVCVVSFPDPVRHFGAPWRQFWILQAVQSCRRWASAPFAARLVLLYILQKLLKILRSGCGSKLSFWSLAYGLLKQLINTYTLYFI